MGHRIRTGRFAVIMFAALMAACIAPAAAFAELSVGDISVQDVSESEPNDTLATAQAISLGTTVRGTISDNDGKDHYRFLLPSSGKLRIAGTAYIGTSHYHLYDARGNEVWGEGWQRANGTTGRLDFDWSVNLVGGTYYLCLEKYGTDTGPYNFALTHQSAGETFAEAQGGSDNTIDAARSISLGSAVRGQLALNDDKDFYRFSLPSSGKLRIAGTAYIGESHYHLYDARGNEVWGEGWQRANGTTGRLDFDWSVDLAGGTYFLCVERGGTGPYNFALTHQSAGETFTEAQGGSDNTIDAARSISLGSAVRGQLALNDDKDFYRFSLPSSGKLRIAGTAYIETSHYHLYDARGNEVWGEGWQRANGTTGWLDFDWSVDLAAGTYFLCVERDTTGPYNFTLSMRRDITAASFSVARAVYTGNDLEPLVTVKSGSTVLKRDVDYTLGYSNNRNAGAGQVKVTGKGAYAGEKELGFTISKAANPMKVKAKGKTFKARKLRANYQTAYNRIKVSKAVGSVTYKNASKVKKLKKFKVNKYNGSITAPWKAKKGTYKVKVKVTASGDGNYKKASKTVTCTIKVK